MSSTQLLSRPSEILLFVFVLTLGFSWLGWLYLPFEAIPLDELRQYLIAVIVGLLTVFVFLDEQGVGR